VPGPYGLGVRVPLLVVSPWSTGGYACSETFDHTSLIRFIEARFGVAEPNITPWRRSVCGDLTSAFDFSSAHGTVPALPSTAAYKPTGTPDPAYKPTPPASGAVPTQEPGVRPSRRLAYAFDADLEINAGSIDLRVNNHGALGVHLQARSLTVAGAPYSYTIGAGDQLFAELPNPGTYDLSLHGPNGFFRHVSGSPTTGLEVDVQISRFSDKVTLRLVDHTKHPHPRHGRSHPEPLVVQVVDAHGRDHQVELRGSGLVTVHTSHSGGWYDLALSTPSDPSFSYQLAGRLENCAQLTSDPLLGAA
jgi:phospholipase C